MLNQWAPQLANYFNENQRYPLVNNIDDLKRELNLSKKLDPVDGWGRNFIYKCENSDTYYLISYGFDGIPGNTVKVQGGQYDVSTDIIVKNGEIIQDFTSAKFE